MTEAKGLSGLRGLRLDYNRFTHLAHAVANQNVAAFEAVHASARYKGSKEMALNDVSFCVQPGTRVALIGPNGSGKSTLLKASAGLLPLSSGEIRLFGLPLAMARHRVAYLPQRGELDWKFPISLRKMVLTGRYVHLGWFRRPSQRDWASADQAIARMKLSDLADRQISELSGGQQQRALLARALAQEADLLLLDEPLNAIDVHTREIVAQVLQEVQREGKSAIVATHDIDHLDTDFDGAVYLSDGQQVDVATNQDCFDAKGLHHRHHHPDDEHEGATSVLGQALPRQDDTP